RGCAPGWKKWGCAMRDERVAEVMKEAMADKRPREGWEQGVLETAIGRLRPSWNWKWALVPVVPFLFVVGLGYYMYSQHQAERSQQDAIIAQKAREAELAKAEAEKQAREFAAIKKELDELQNQLNKATTDAERKRLQERMNSLMGSAARRGHAHGMSG